MILTPVWQELFFSSIEVPFRVEGFLLAEHPGLIHIFLGKVCLIGEEVRDEDLKKSGMRKRMRTSFRLAV